MWLALQNLPQFPFNPIKKLILATILLEKKTLKAR
jgi:hypothetical protein